VIIYYQSSATFSTLSNHELLVDYIDDVRRSPSPYPKTSDIRRFPYIRHGFARKDILDRIGQPELSCVNTGGAAARRTVAQLIGAFANTKGAPSFLGVVNQGKGRPHQRLSAMNFAPCRSPQAIDLSLRRHRGQIRFVDHQGKRLFVIEVQRSATPVLLGGKSYVRDAFARPSRSDARKVIKNAVSQVCLRLSKTSASPARPRERSCWIIIESVS